jgi:hypothetical protein
MAMICFGRLIIRAIIDPIRRGTLATKPQKKAPATPISSAVISGNLDCHLSLAFVVYGL